MGMNTQELPPLFDQHGAFIGYDAELFDSLPDDRKPLYRGVETASAVCVQAEDDLQTALDHVKACADRVAECEAAMPKPMSFHQLWLDTVKGTRHG